MTKFEKVRAALEARKDRSAWNKGVTLYALDLLDTLEEAARGGWVAIEDLNDGQILKKNRDEWRRRLERLQLGRFRFDL